MKSEKGLISLYVLFGMLFLLVFILSIYIGIRNKMQLEEYKNLELEELYSKNIDFSRDIEFAENNEFIPIYNINQLDVVGTGSYLRINNKIYKCGIGMFYILKDDMNMLAEEKAQVEDQLDEYFVALDASRSISHKSRNK